MPLLVALQASPTFDCMSSGWTVPIRLHQALVHISRRGDSMIKNKFKCCSSCGLEKADSEFYKDSRTRDGLYGACKVCTLVTQTRYAQSPKGKAASLAYSRLPRAKAAAKRYRESPEGKAIRIRYNHSPRGKIARALGGYRYRLRHPGRKSARLTVHWALKLGILKRQPCEVCGFAKVEGHHDDYSKPLKVRWLCRKDHLDIHKTW